MPAKPKIFVLVGTTASGKTDISIELARKYPIEIINADSLQVFRKLDIGTAKVSSEIRREVPHHMIDILNPDENFTAKAYKIEAEKCAMDVIRRKKIPLFVGGAGFYLKAISDPISNLPQGLKKLGNPKEDYQILATKDPQAAAKIHENDHYRISRALFLLEKGILPSKAFKVRRDEESIFRIKWLGIHWERKDLHLRIDQRVRWMFDRGLMDETRDVLREFPNSEFRLRRTIGYRECLEALSGKITPQEAQSLTTIRTRQYAKRQTTWFRRNLDIQWSRFNNALDDFSFLGDQV